MPSAAAGSAIMRASWPPPMTATTGASPEVCGAGCWVTQRPYPATSALRTTDRDRLEIAEPAHRSRRQDSCLVPGQRQSLRGVQVGDHPVAPGHADEPGGEV